MENDIEYMTSAYRILYEIETILKANIQSTLFEKYSVNWDRAPELTKPLDKMFYHDIVTFYDHSPICKGIFTNDEIYRLFSLRDVRNDVAHMSVLSTKQFDLLCNCRDLVKRIERQVVMD
ncbi:hypothetical protein [Salipaludibacillus daqingensis]|uniref:hypothetical protein n=1 Tax=Salipaludibacillus daqingensis TaxID=3041001 RepID=UPI0024770212|nr:hypothetical protein [Salipaludibacillus daqingensis]